MPYPECSPYIITSSPPNNPATPIPAAQGPDMKQGWSKAPWHSNPSQ